MQQGRHAARNILAMMNDDKPQRFRDIIEALLDSRTVEPGDVGGGFQRCHLDARAFGEFIRLPERLGNHEKDGYRNETFSGRIGVTPLPYFDIDFVARATESHAEVDNGGGAGQDEPAPERKRDAEPRTGRVEVGEAAGGVFELATRSRDVRRFERCRDGIPRPPRGAHRTAARRLNGTSR